RQRPRQDETGRDLFRASLSADAVRLALALNHPVYDCIYLALAQRIGAVLVTADSRFAKVLAPTGHGESVMTLAQYLEME
ncbi:MAG: type II toxin-antitoxin system VapC family toxin, partial [Gammaproteobacteria bacterium]|nr:type II toxin-antitoxin system VapC family toxin [Gammaproteobacteria bacterium]MYE30397.1 type II toxin-antitoxin system VapC family toxin [Gammaproteobacteria bacterium]